VTEQRDKLGRKWKEVQSKEFNDLSFSTGCELHCLSLIPGKAGILLLVTLFRLAVESPDPLSTGH
jgi:hypothetical protein